MLSADPPSYLDGLNQAQRDAVVHEGGPLLVIAGAGSGKTNTLAHRVAHLIVGGADPRRILLLTFTRRAAAEMTRRAQRIIAQATSTPSSAVAVAGGSSAAVAGGGRRAAELRWSGTFHAIANRLLRLHHRSIGLDPSFTVLDRSDAADFMNFLRNEQGLAKKSKRFPRKSTCLSIYSRVVNAQEPLEKALNDSFPWCEEWADDLRGLFRAYVEGKQERHVLDYDDLLLYWYHLMSEPALAQEIGERFDHVLVDEYQDTNALQAAILLAMKPTGKGLTVVGDDAQSIYAFRAANIKNILGFPDQFESRARVVTLEQNYRSTQPILEAANAVINLSAQRYAKELFSIRKSQQLPVLATVEDETCQVEYVVERILENREAGLELKRQAVLFRAGHHSDSLEVELGRRNIPFVKYGGLKFLEAAHVKDVLCVLRWAENPADSMAAFRVLQMLPGIGPAAARHALEHVAANGAQLSSLESHQPPASARELWPAFAQLMAKLSDETTAWAGQLGMVRQVYQPLLEQNYDSAHVRVSDVEQLEQIAGEYPSRERFLTEVTLDPPDATGDQAGPPLLDEDFLILSTIHSAKGQEWDAVYVLNCTDGCIPSDMATGKPEQIEEERRLLYVAMTRAKDHLHLVHPLRMYIRQQSKYGDRHVYTPVTRFVPDNLHGLFEPASRGRNTNGDGDDAMSTSGVRVDVASKLRGMW